MKRTKKQRTYTGAQVASLIKSERADAYRKGQASCPNDHITVTTAIGEAEPNNVYCLVRAVPIEISDPPAVGFSA